ncbi:hypothetical protein OPT61_g203 [Boeremia exigua]|uniref:Uncharacterized protein n=1 Tax=Boeremia exigua TaxID=749465 RepID=A0ACC2IUP7_9PLEO|nr:hypothetical protein OPT61_g203 [Boeremia exigua]
MPSPTLHKLARRLALALIIGLQAAHFVLQMLDLWGPPRKANPKLTTGAKLNEFGFCCITFSNFVEYDLDARIGRHVIRGSGVDAVLVYIVVWSTAIVFNDALGNAAGLMSLSQLMVVDVLMWCWMLGKGVAWVKRQQDEVVGGEKVSGGVQEKMEV